MIAVITGLIIGFQSDINSSIDSLLGGDKERDAETVQISGDSPADDLASLIDSCYNRYLENSFEDYVCFIANAEQGNLDLSGQKLESRLSGDISEVTEVRDSYRKSTVVIRFSSDKGMIVVE